MLILMVPRIGIEPIRSFKRWILRVLERDFHRKISTGYLPYFRGVERGAERTVKSFYTPPTNGLKVSRLCSRAHYP